MVIQIGDSVTLKTGGIVMTVEHIIGNCLGAEYVLCYSPEMNPCTVICSWPTGSGVTKGGTFKSEDLKVFLPTFRLN